MPERSEEADQGVKPQTVSQTHPNVHMEVCLTPSGSLVIQYKDQQE